MAELTTKEQVDRLPVLISGVATEQLLGVPKLPSGTGEAQAAAVVQLVKEWGIEDCVAALCFDTTASNTGHRQGACVFIKQMPSKDLYLACHHHVIELIVGAAFDQVLCLSSGPDIAIFKRFQEHWPFIDHECFQRASTDPHVESLVTSNHSEVAEFALSQLQVQHPRDSESSWNFR